MLKELSLYELLIGRGMGGYYTSVRWSTGNAVVNAEGTRARISCHIGLAVFILKGGLVFFIINMLFYLPILLPKGRGWYRNRVNMAVMAVVPVYLAFQLVESSPFFTTYADTALVGLIWARLGRRQPSYAAQAEQYYYLVNEEGDYQALAPEQGYAYDQPASGSC